MPSSGVAAVAATVDRLPDLMIEPMSKALAAAAYSAWVVAGGSSGAAAHGNIQAAMTTTADSANARLAPSGSARNALAASTNGPYPPSGAGAESPTNDDVDGGTSTSSRANTRRTWVSAMESDTNVNGPGEGRDSQSMSQHLFQIVPLLDGIGK